MKELPTTRIITLISLDGGSIRIPAGTNGYACNFRDHRADVQFPQYNRFLEGVHVVNLDVVPEGKPFSVEGPSEQPSYMAPSTFED